MYVLHFSSVTARYFVIYKYHRLCLFICLLVSIGVAFMNDFARSIGLRGLSIDWIERENECYYLLVHLSFVIMWSQCEGLSQVEARSCF